MSLPKSVWSRSSLLIKTAGKMAYKELESRVQTSPLGKRIEQAEELVKALSQMKGAAMKVGQLLSLDATDLFPPEVIKVLSQLQADAGALPFEEIRSILIKELGETQYQKIDFIDPTPLAAASIGQVHRATINGKDYVLKIQYPGVADTIDSDINLLEKLISQMFFFSGRKKIEIKPLMTELKEVLKLETNYLQEAQFLTRYQKNFAKDSRFIIPKVDLEYTTQKVLCLEFCSGLPLRNWLEAEPSTQDAQELAKYALELYLTEFYQWGLVQTDPNFGNFLIQENPLKIVLLDFGSTKQYSSSFIQKYKRIVKAAFDDKDEELLEATFEMNLMDKRESTETRIKYIKMMKAIVAPFQQPEDFDFTDSEFVSLSKDLSLEFTQALEYSPPPKELIFLHRKLGGIFGLMKRCKAKIALRPYMEDVLNS
jgi:aarF domain-containing kinase